MKRIDGHPHILYDAGPSAAGGWLIVCKCLGCGDHWHRPCQYPKRSGEWIQRYLNLHQHCRPRRAPPAHPHP